MPQGVTLVRAEQDDPKGKPSNLWYVLKDQTVLGGKDIKNPEQSFDNGAGGTGAPNVLFDFTGRGASTWETFTKKLAQRGQEQALGASGRRVQPALRDRARQRAHLGAADPVAEVPERAPVRRRLGDLRRLHHRDGSAAGQPAEDRRPADQAAADLGLAGVGDAGQAGAATRASIAGVAGFIIVALFLLVFYRVLGVIAVGALVVYAVFFYALIKLVPITMTLPGIAGLILTIGVAADANIVIFERVKEELRGGRSIPAAIATGYKRGLSAIVDANVVTFMVAFILFLLATAGVKGFAFTLGVGTLVSFFTAVLLTQAVLGAMGRSKLIHSPAALGVGKHRERKRFDYMGASKWFFSMSGVILLIGALAIGGKGLNFGIDFESGTRVKTELNRSAERERRPQRDRARAASATPRSSASAARARARTPSRSPRPR